MADYPDYGQLGRDSTTLQDTDRDERESAPYRRGFSDYKTSDEFSPNMIGKMGGSTDLSGKMDLGTGEKFKLEDLAPEQYLELPDAKWDVELAQEEIPDTKSMPLRSLNFPYSPGTAFWLEIGESANEAGEQFARKTMTEVYQMFQNMAPALTFSPSLRDLKCKGTYTWSTSSCTWEIQIWRVNPAVARSKSPGNEYILECRKKVKGGNESFMRLVEIVGWLLKEQGRATMFANGCEIFPPALPTENLGKLAIPGLGSLQDISLASIEETEFPVDLDEDIVKQMTMGIADRRYPQCSENMALLAECAVDMNNREVLKESDDLTKAVHQELMMGTDLNTCINALTLLEYGAVSSKGALPAVARALMVHSGFKESGFKRIRSRAVECTALRVMAKLACNIGEDRDETLLEIEKDLRGKLKYEIFSKVQDIRTCRPAVDVF